MSSRWRPRVGFTLLEAVVALAVLGVVLTSMLTLLVQHTRLDRRLDAHTGALRALEAHHEALRAYWTPTTSSNNFWQGGNFVIAPLQSPAAVDSFTMSAEVTPLVPAGLFKIKLVARYSLGRQQFDQSMETRFWRP